MGFVDFTTGSPVWEGWGFLTSVNIDAPMEDNTTISLSFQGLNVPRLSGVTNLDPNDRPSDDDPGAHY